MTAHSPEQIARHVIERRTGSCTVEDMEALAYGFERLAQRLKEAEAERDSLVMARAEAISERSRATLLERKLSEAVSQEREACAALCAGMAASIAGTVGVGCSMCERAIRERSKP